MGHAAYRLGFQSQEHEMNISSLPVSGTIPPWLSGSLIRTAPSKFEIGKKSYNHWFDGLAMLHKFTFHNQQVGYACRFLQSEAYRAARKENKIVYGEFGTDPCRDLFQKVASYFKVGRATDNGCVNINQHGHELTAETETPQPVIFDLNTLETKGHFHYTDALEGQMTIVHPHYEPDGTLFSYTTQFGMHTHYLVYALLPGSRERKQIASIEVDKPAYMHSIGMTDHYIILTEFPFIAEPLDMRFNPKPFIEHYHWKPERGTKIYLVDKSTGLVQTFETDAFFAFHHVNAYEEGHEVVFDLIAYHDPQIIFELYLDHLREDQLTNVTGRLCRFRVDPETGKVRQEELSSASLELPRINYARVNARPYRFVYGAGCSQPGNFLDNLCKVDVEERKETIWQEVNCFPGEPVFVEKPGAESEDDGILLSVVLNAHKRNSFLLMLDARTMKEVGRAEVPQHITFGFHGQFVHAA